LQRENSGSRALSVALSEHDTKNTANVAMLLQSAEFKLQPGKDFVEYQELVKLRLEDGIDVTRKVGAWGMLRTKSWVSATAGPWFSWPL
jgi:hypothetical protein